MCHHSGLSLIQAMTMSFTYSNNLLSHHMIMSTFLWKPAWLSPSKIGFYHKENTVAKPGKIRCWLVVVLFSAACFCLCMPTCNRWCSCCWPLSPSIVDHCPQVVSSPAAAHICCCRHWLVVALMSATRFYLCTPSGHQKRYYAPFMGYKFIAYLCPWG